MKSFRTEAVVIRRRNFLEKDRILTLFSREDGKIEALSKGARRPGSKLSYCSDIGMVGKFQIYKGKKLDIVTEIEPVFSPEGARGEFNKTEKLGFLFRIIDKLYHEQEPHKATYDLLVQAVKDISQDNYQLIFMSFLLRVVEDLGLKPELYQCITCRKPIGGEERFDFSSRGGVCHTDCQSGEAATEEEIKLLRLIYKEPFNKISKSTVKKSVFLKTYQLVEKYFEWNFGKILPDKVL